MTDHAAADHTLMAAGVTAADVSSVGGAASSLSAPGLVTVTATDN